MGENYECDEGEVKTVEQLVSATADNLDRGDIDAAIDYLDDELFYKAFKLKLDAIDAAGINVDNLLATLRAMMIFLYREGYARGQRDMEDKWLSNQ